MIFDTREGSEGGVEKKKLSDDLTEQEKSGICWHVRETEAARRFPPVGFPRRLWSHDFSVSDFILLRAQVTLTALLEVGGKTASGRLIIPQVCSLVENFDREQTGRR